MLRGSRYNSSFGAVSLEYVIGAVLLVAAIAGIAIMLRQVSGHRVAELNRTEHRIVPCPAGDLTSDRCK